MSRGLALLCLLCIASCRGADSGDAGQLPSLHALAGVTVSGVSSGAYMAAQYQVAYADEVSGAALVAGGPWGCAAGDLRTALGPCLDGPGVDPGALVDHAQALAADGHIASLRNLSDDRVYLFHGSGDTVVAATLIDLAADWYRHFVASAALHVERGVPAAHGWPTVERGAPCNELRPPYLNACGFDLAGELLAHLYGDLQPAAGGAFQLRRFHQRAAPAAGLAQTGLVFIPPQCEAGSRCRVHLFFHGCSQSFEQVGEDVAAQAGFLGWAQANDLIVLFPQAAASRQAPANPLACWDWWGYSGADYLQRDGAQLAAVRALVRRLQARP